MVQPLKFSAGKTTSMSIDDPTQFSALGIGTSPDDQSLRIQSHIGFPNSYVMIYTSAIQTDGLITSTLSQLTLADNTCYKVDASVVCRDTTGTLVGACARTTRVHRQDAGTAILGIITALGTDDFTGGLPIVTFDVTNNDICLNVTGILGLTINWVATITLQGVSSNV